MEAELLYNRLKVDYKKIFLTEKRIKNIRAQNNAYIANRDLELMYDAMFLKSITIFESFIEELFIGLLYDNYKLNTKKKVQKHIFPNRKLVLNFLKHKNSYIEVMPYSKLKDTSNVFFREDNPFLSISENSKNSLNEIYIIRNAIAHKSQFAELKFKKLMANKGVSSPKIYNSPARYLKTLNSPDRSTFNNYILELNAAAREIIDFN